MSNWNSNPILCREGHLREMFDEFPRGEGGQVNGQDSRPSCEGERTRRLERDCLSLVALSRDEHVFGDEGGGGTR